MSIIQRSHVGPRLSEAAIFNGVIYLAGQIANDATKDIAGQTAEVLKCIDLLLEEHGSDKSKILQCVIYLDNMSLFEEMNKVWDAWVPKGATPPRATVEAKLATPGKLIEIVVTAAQ